MRIVLLSVDDEFAGLMQARLYERRSDWIVGSLISTREIYKKTKIGAVAFVIKRSGFYYFMQMVWMKMLRRILSPRQTNVPSTLARRHRVEVFWSANINAPESIERLKEWKPDVMISTNFSHYIGKAARSVARVGAWNLHKSYLPHYRGMAPSFFALLEGARLVGATLHVVDAGFDTGPILAQVRVPVAQGDTVYSLNRRTSEFGGRMLADFVESVKLEEIRPVPQEDGVWRNYTYPNRAEVALFRRKGLRFDRLGD
jgi:folate-dependent phosphoribosylglycinamide formyltransferase PurN